MLILQVENGFILRMLLNVIKGARSFEEIRTINNVVYPTFRSACYALGLLDDDKEWHKALNHHHIGLQGNNYENFLSQCWFFVRLQTHINYGFQIASCYLRTFSIIKEQFYDMTTYILMISNYRTMDYVKLNRF